ncbi:MAG: AsmA-like C-terminal region-containing protein, partial [Opitutaceae bacterium]
AIVFGGRWTRIDHLAARVAGIAFSAQGTFSTPQLGPTSRGETPATLFAGRFPTLCRQAMTALEKLKLLQGATVHVDLTPADTRIAVVDVTVFARGLSLDSPLALQARGLRLNTRLPLNDALATVQIDLSADELRLPRETNLRGVRAVAFGQFRPGDFQFAPRELQLTVESAESAGFSAGALAAHLVPGPLPLVGAEIVGLLAGSPISVRADADFSARRGRVRFDGALSPKLLPPLSAMLRVDVRKYFDFSALECSDGDVSFGPGWKFERLTARVAVRGISAYRVAIEEGRAAIEFDGRRFFAPEASARIGENFARGSFEQDLKTREYRFLLDGRMRPLAISGWFREWWPDFFAQLEFPSAAPTASVDVRGIWGEGRRSTVFVAADSLRPVIRGAAFEHVRTRLFIRPGFFDGLEVFATDKTGVARGTFTYVADPEAKGWRSLALALSSTVDPALAVKIWGPPGEKILGPFAFALPPAVKLAGRFDGPNSPGGAHQTLQLETRTSGEVRFHGFPLEDLSFTTNIRDENIAVDNMEARFAGGIVAGQAKVWGADDDRRVGFAYTLKDASLGLAAAALERYRAELNRRPPAPPGKFVQEKANVRLDLAAAAEGRYADAYSFKGQGTAFLQGAEIGEVPLLGMLSDLLKFTALRFTTARASFKIDGNKIEFPEVAFRGANSAIDAHGEYALDRHELDFKAKLFPFQESGGLIKSVVGAVLAPISSVFEVKLTGNIQKPEWAFVIGPTNFLRSLAPENEPTKPAATPRDGTPAPSPPGAP